MKRFCLTSLLVLSVSSPAVAQTPDTAASSATTTFPAVTFGVVSFLQYAAELHESDGYNSFDVTRGYFNVEARLSNRVKVRFTPDVRPTTDASLERNLALRLEYASLDVQVTDNTAIMFGLHEMPWLTYEETLNRYRVLGPFFSERAWTEDSLGLLPGPTDLGKVSVSGFYQYGWYAEDRPRNVAIGMGAYENTNIALTVQYLQATDNPFVAVDVQRRGLSFFGEARQGETGWAGIVGLDLFDPNADNDGDQRRRLLFGGAHWNEFGRSKIGVVVSLDQEYQTSNSQLLSRRLLAQTHIEF